MGEDLRPLRCPICDFVVPCFHRFATPYCLAMHIAAKWDDSAHIIWRKEHGINPVVYQSLGDVQTLVRQIMTFLPQQLDTIK
jgi:hypothetical protein